MLGDYIHKCLHIKITPCQDAACACLNVGRIDMIDSYKMWLEISRDWEHIASSMIIWNLKSFLAYET